MCVTHSFADMSYSNVDRVVDGEYIYIFIGMFVCVFMYVYAGSLMVGKLLR